MCWQPCSNTSPAKILLASLDCNMVSTGIRPQETRLPIIDTLEVHFRSNHLSIWYFKRSYQPFSVLPSEQPYWSISWFGIKKITRQKAGIFSWLSCFRCYRVMKLGWISWAQCPIQVRQLLPWGLLYLTSCFHLFWKNILSAKYVDWGPPHLNLVVCCIFHLLIPLLCKT